jgi:hypothetical protein
MACASRDFGISVYPIASSTSTLTVRADLVQKQAPSNEKVTFKPIFSTSFLLAARDGTTHQKFELPQIDLRHSDDLSRAE